MSRRHAARDEALVRTRTARKFLESAAEFK
jgi:hypothetical protein